MTEKIDIAEILKDKPANTKLYSPLFGEVYFSHVGGGNIAVEHHGGISLFFSSGRFFDYDESEPLLFPSKEMRDWSKFAWKKGDILVNKDAKVHIIFDGFEDDTYKNFRGQYYLWEEEGCIVSFEEDENYMQTSDFNKANKEDVQEYIHKIEKELGGKLNMETLEIEKPQPKFKDGDIVFVECEKGLAETTFIYKMHDVIDIHDEAQCYAAIFNKENKSTTCGSVLTYGRTLRFATDSEKQQLFDALAKEAKAWDAEKKQIVDLKPNIELKPFDKVLVRDFSRDKWSISFFSFKKEDLYVCINHCSWNQCIPYIGNESLLGTTKDVEG